MGWFNKKDKEQDAQEIIDEMIKEELAKVKSNLPDGVQLVE